MMEAPDGAAARSAADSIAQAQGSADLAELDARVVSCRACPRLVSWREEVARSRRRAFADQAYWGRPVPGFGDPEARVMVVGLAPAAHGANRTGRMFTGDRSGDFLFAALYRAGVASSPVSTAAGDGLRLYGVRITAAVRCAPPQNAPTPAERAACAPWLDRELELVTPRAVLALGAIGWRAALAALGRLGMAIPRPRPRFAHGAQARLAPAAEGAGGMGPVGLVGCYHPSQQNTFTGRLTETMMDEVIQSALTLGRG